MKVCVAEKPSVARDIAAILGADRNMGGYLEGNGYQVTWVFGHLCELKEPHEYNPAWKRWELFYLPMIPEKFGIRLKNDDGVKRQFDTIAALIKKAEEVINCGDAGQEGELIQRWVYQKAGCKCPVKRLWISSLTEEAIREGFQNLKPQSEYDKLYEAGAMRAIGDWLLGMNATRAYTTRYGYNHQVLSIGRVQTPTLALVVKRYEEIENFVPEKYWELKTTYRDVVFNSTKGRFSSKEEGEQFLQTVVNSEFEVTDVSNKKGTEAPPRLFDLTSLQVECNKRFAMSADDTLRAIQSLYEKKYTTYPRVDTTYLPEDMYPKIPAIMQGIQPYAQLTAPVLASKIVKTKRIFDNSKITDHHAIIPTGVPAYNMTPDEARVYDFVVRRFIANFYPDCQFNTTTVLGKVDKVEFKTTGKQITSPGWRVLFAKGQDDEEDKKDKDEEKTLPLFVVGEHGPHKPDLLEKLTTPPKPYTEATLLRAMETAGKLVDDEELRDLMKENGIGRPSTRAAILETLYRRNYMRKERKNIIPTITGIELIHTIHYDLLKSAELTGQWEKKLRMIEHSEYNGPQFMQELKAMVTDVVANVKADTTGRVTASVQAQRAETPKKSEQPGAEGEKKEDAPKKTRKRTPKKKDGGDEGEATVSASPKPPVTPPSSPMAALVCPVCGKGRILRGKTAYGCSEWRAGCQFRLPFNLMNHQLTEQELTTLLGGGEIVINNHTLHLSEGNVVEK